MLSEAEREAAILIAEGEAEYMRILSEAYNDETKQDFYSFVRSLDALKLSMQGGIKQSFSLPTLLLPRFFMGGKESAAALTVLRNCVTFYIRNRVSV